MPELCDITLYTVTKTMSALDCLFHQDPDLYEDFIGEICTEFTLAKEYMQAIQEMSAEGMHKESLVQLDMILRHLLALWVLQNNMDIPLTDQEQIQ
ncbi:MAG: hypothetical protein GX055_01790 [Desulfovibrionales bacterium]|nr:hypothetical protein [Desulfovibrionales bacterium]